MHVSPDTEEIIIISPFAEEDDYSYFCKYDELTGVVACPGTYLPSISESCYASRADIFPSA